MNIEQLERETWEQARRAQQWTNRRARQQGVAPAQIYHAVRADALQYHLRRIGADLERARQRLAASERELERARPWVEGGEALVEVWRRRRSQYGDTSALRCLRGPVIRLEQLKREQGNDEEF